MMMRLIGLWVGQYEGDSGGDLLFGSYYHNGMSFTTYDRDNDQNAPTNCATSRGGGWWYNNCYWTCLTCSMGRFEWYDSVGYTVNSRMMVKRQWRTVYSATWKPCTYWQMSHPYCLCICVFWLLHEQLNTFNLHSMSFIVNVMNIYL